MKKLLILILFCLSCGTLGPKPFHYVGEGASALQPWKTYSVWVDKEFGNADKLAIEDAVTQWNYALNGYVEIKVVSTDFDMEPDLLKRIMGSSNGWVVLKIRSDNPMVNSNEDKGTLAFVNDVGGNKMWVVRDRVTDSRWMTGIVLHEMGHMLGSNHNPDYLMQPGFRWEDFRCVDYGALQKVAEAQHIPMARLRYCVYE